MILTLTLVVLWLVIVFFALSVWALLDLRRDYRAKLAAYEAKIRELDEISVRTNIALGHQNQFMEETGRFVQRLMNEPFNPETYEPRRRSVH